MSARLIVVGGDAAGMSAASQARRLDDEMEIVAFERGRFTSYSACGIPYWIGGAVDDPDSLIVRRPETFAGDQNISVRLHHEVVAIDVAARKIVARDVRSGQEVREGFDHLMIGTGAVPNVPEVEGSDAQGIFGIQTLEDAHVVSRDIEGNSPRRGVIVGGGYIGLEMAEALAERGLDVSLVEQADQPMRSLDPDMGALVADAITSVGVKLYTSETVEGFENERGRVTAVVTDQRRLPADIVVTGLGVKPNVGVARDAGLKIGASGAIAVAPSMETSEQGIYAGGDCAEKTHRLTGDKVTLPLGTHANKEGIVAGMNIAGRDASFPGVIGTAITRICGHEVARTGLNDKEAEEAGFDPRSTTIEAPTKAGYFPGAEKMKVKMTVDGHDGRILGGQIVGGAGSGKRIDVIATAIWNAMTAGELIWVDLSYAPPFAPLWDPVLIAARQAARLVG